MTERLKQLVDLYICEPGDLTDEEIQELLDAGIDLEALDASVEEEYGL